MSRPDHELSPSPEHAHDIRIFDSEPWEGRTAVDDLIDLQNQAFVLELSKDPDKQEKMGAVYTRMADIEGSIDNHGEELGYAYQAIEAFEEAGKRELTIAGYCVAARAAFKMGVSGAGYRSLQSAIATRVSVSQDIREELAGVNDDTIIDRHRPAPASVLPQITGEESALSAIARSTYANVLNDRYEAFEEWLQKQGQAYVAQQLRKLEEGEQSGRSIRPLVNVFGQFLTRYRLPKDLSQQLIGDIDKVQDFGPYPDFLDALDVIEGLNKVYQAAAGQPGVRRKQRRAISDQISIMGSVIYYANQGTHFGGFRTVPKPVDNIRSLLERHRR